MTTESNLEALVTAQNAHFYAMGTQNEARMESRLFGAAVDCGMPHNTDDLHGWVAIAVGKFLLSGPCDDGDFWDTDDGIGHDEFGILEYVR